MTKRPRLTVEIIEGSVQNDPVYIEQLLTVFESYINHKSTLRTRDAEGQWYTYLEYEVKHILQQTVRSAILKFRI